MQFPVGGFRVPGVSTCHGLCHFPLRESQSGVARSFRLSETPRFVLLPARRLNAKTGESAMRSLVISKPVLVSLCGVRTQGWVRSQKKQKMLFFGPNEPATI